MWHGYRGSDRVTESVVHAHTVVIEIHRLFAWVTTLTERPISTKSRRALNEAS